MPRRRPRRRRGARDGRDRARSRGRRPRTTTISQSGRSGHASRSASMSAAGVNGSAAPKIASVGHASAAVSSGSLCSAPLPVLGHADHPVERDRAVEATGAPRPSSAYRPPMQNPRIDDAVTSSSTTSGRPARSRSPSCVVVVEVRRPDPCVRIASSWSRSLEARRTARARTPRARGSRAGGTGRRTAGAAHDVGMEHDQPGARACPSGRAWIASTGVAALTAQRRCARPRPRAVLRAVLPRRVVASRRSARGSRSPRGGRGRP